MSKNHNDYNKSLQKTMEAYNDSIYFFNKQALLLEKAFFLIFENTKDAEKIIFLFLLGSAMDCSKAIFSLAQNGFSNECYILSRAFLERIINFCYLHITTKEEIQNFIEYSIQKEIKKLHRKISAGDKSVGFQFDGKIKFNDELKNVYEIKYADELKKIIGKFTSNKGKEIKRWTNKSLQKRAVEVEKYLQDKPYFLLAILYIYEDASEALHGTFYGSIFHQGVTEPATKKQISQLLKSQKKFEYYALFKKKNFECLTTLLIVLGVLCIDSFLNFLSINFFNYLSELQTISNKNCEEITKKIKEVLS